METTPDHFELIDHQGWNEYWKSQNVGGRLYALIAAFYRRFIIRPNLNQIIHDTFPVGSSLVHAGCGSGEVDLELKNKFKLTGLDISPVALRRYKSNNSPQAVSVHASIFQMPFSDHSQMGIYNLGVMEHFSELEIGKILQEFKRVLADNGKVVLFWPPEYGLSVLFFKTACKIYLTLLGKSIKFHPDEITRLRSFAHAEELLKASGFEIVRYSFSIRDLWTYAVIVAKPVNT